MLKLNSVGSVIDKRTKIVYPQNVDGTPDLDCGVHITECPDDWFSSLSKMDIKTIYIIHIKYSAIRN